MSPRQISHSRVTHQDLTLEDEILFGHPDPTFLLLVTNTGTHSLFGPLQGQFLGCYHRVPISHSLGRRGLPLLLQLGPGEVLAELQLVFLSVLLPPVQKVIDWLT